MTAWWISFLTLTTLGAPVSSGAPMTSSAAMSTLADSPLVEAELMSLEAGSEPCFTPTVLMSEAPHRPQMASSSTHERPAPMCAGLDAAEDPRCRSLPLGLSHTFSEASQGFALQAHFILPLTRYYQMVAPKPQEALQRPLRGHLPDIFRPPVRG